MTSQVYRACLRFSVPGGSPRTSLQWWIFRASNLEGLFQIGIHLQTSYLFRNYLVSMKSAVNLSTNASNPASVCKAILTVMIHQKTQIEGVIVRGTVPYPQILQIRILLRSPYYRNHLQFLIGTGDPRLGLHTSPKEQACALSTEKI